MRWGSRPSSASCSSSPRGASFAVIRWARGDPSVTWRAFTLAMVVAWALTLQFWVASPWNLVFFLVPGAKGLRVVSRYQLWLTLPFLLIMVFAWRARMAALLRTRPWWGVAIVALLMAENLSAETAAQLSRREQRAALDAIPAAVRLREFLCRRVAGG
ncbi:hypothetical protein P0F65_19030 [Sphingomonas sp. I4]